MNSIIERVKTGVWEFAGQIWNQVSEEAKDLVTMMLQVRGFDMVY
jgi:hypothetical protein